MISERISALINLSVLQHWHSVIALLILFFSAVAAVLLFFAVRSKEKLAIVQRWTAVLVVLLSAIGYMIYVFETRATATLAALHQAQDLAKAEEAQKQGELSRVASSQQAERFRKALTKADRLIAATQQRAQDALAEADRQKIELISLRENLKPRRLTALKRVELAILLRTFPDLPTVIAWIVSGGKETAVLASDFVSASLNSGRKNISTELVEGYSFNGIEISCGTARFAEANAIARFLVEVGLSSRPVPGHHSSDPQQLELVIGWKP